MKSLSPSTPGSVTRIHTSEQISQIVVSTVARATGADPLDLEPLYDVVDPDALDRLFRSATPATKLSFEMVGCEVVVHGDGEVVVTPPESDADAVTSTGRND